jgi:uncharacterized RDD family membrane protein YckC
VVAQTIDALILLLLGLIIPGGVGGLVLWALVTLAYFGVLQGVTGLSLGKALLRIRVVNREGSAPGWLAGVKRALPLLVEFSGIVALAFIGTSTWRQRGGDRWAHTYVVENNAVFELRSAREASERTGRSQGSATAPSS